MATFDGIYAEFLKKYPIYRSLLFSTQKHFSETLHPLYIISQFIVDSLTARGKKRIALVMPMDGCNVIPLVLSKYFSNLKYEKNYTRSNIFDDIDVGQRLRLGKAVVEFLGFSDYQGKHITIKVDRHDPTLKITYPVGDTDYLFQKTTGAITTHKIWIREKHLVEQKVAESSEIINSFSMRKALLQKSIILISTKNYFYDAINGLEINDTYFSDLALFGEIDNDSINGFKLANKGRVEGIPSVAVTSKLEELYYFLKTDNKEKVSMIFSTLDKFYELTSNPDTLEKILLHDIPVTVFLSENDFESCSLLESLDFVIWHWKPITLNSGVMLIEKTTQDELSIFSTLSRRVNCATLSDFRIEVAEDDDLRATLKELKIISEQTSTLSESMKHIIRKLWFVQRFFLRFICPFHVMKDKIVPELLSISTLFEKEKKYYPDLACITSINTVLNKLNKMFFSENQKEVALARYLANRVNTEDSVLILVPDDYNYVEESSAYYRRYTTDGKLSIIKISDFHKINDSSHTKVEHLIATWFDYGDYLAIKQAYCYEHLVFILYDIEHKWREHFVERINQCIPHDKLINLARGLNIDDFDFEEKVFDNLKTPPINEIKEISDYKTSSNIIKSTIEGHQDCSASSSIEYIPILLSGGKIGFFYPKHDIIDVTNLIKGLSDRPLKKEAHLLRKGDHILVRQSDRDFIREKADELMKSNDEMYLRSISDEWFVALERIASNRTMSEIQRILRNAGADCSFQNIRGWLSGETIMPEGKDVLTALATIACTVSGLKEITPILCSNINSVFEAGKKVRSYHQKAGIWLSNELKYKANEIKMLSTSGKTSGNIEKIGIVNFYTVEEVLNIDYIDKSKLNKIASLF